MSLSLSTLPPFCQGFPLEPGTHHSEPAVAVASAHTHTNSQQRERGPCDAGADKVVQFILLLDACSAFMMAGP